MKKLLPWIAFLAGMAAAPAAPAADDAKTETIVFIRHGEKPADGKGQLNCRGLNRALALPRVLLGKFGNPGFLFAPCTTLKPDGGGVNYSYVRPLVTIEPTAIQLDLPIDARFSFGDAAGLEHELSAPQYEGAVIFVAWEHRVLDDIVKDLIRSFGGNADAVPEWPSDDYDSIFVVRVQTSEGKRTASFEHDHEGLNGLSDQFPAAAGK